MDRTRDYAEKRDFIRMQVNVPATLSTESQHIDTQCVDLSATGAKLISPSAIAVGAHVQVNIDSPQPLFSGLSAEAEVIRCEEEQQEFVIALRIVKIS